MASRGSSIIIALVISGAAAAWVLSGEITIAPEAPPAAASPAVNDPANTAPGAFRVQVVALQAEPYVAETVLRGRTEASRRVELRAQTGGPVAEILAERGTQVAAGQPLLRLDMEDREAQRAEAAALVQQREVEYAAAVQLAESGYRGEVQLAGARAALDQARAMLAAIELDIRYTTVLAPFDGVLDDRPMEIGDWAQPGDRVAVVVDLDPILIVGEVSEREVAGIEVGALGTARLVTGEELQGIVRYIASTGDGATRTFRVELEVANPQGLLRDGVTAEMRLPRGQVLAHRLPPSALTLADDGTIGARIIATGNVVQFVPVTIIAYDANGVWAVGLPDQVTLIVVGQEFVHDGQVVTPVKVTAAEQPA